VLRAIYGTAVADGLVATNPCQLKGAGATKRGERPTLSVAEIGQLADEVPGRYSALVHLLAWSGALIGERRRPRAAPSCSAPTTPPTSPPAKLRC
jgi:hypothetical protein